MKKQYLALMLIMISACAFANTTITWLPPNSSNIGYDTARVVYKVTATSIVGNHKEKLLVKKGIDSAWIAADSIMASTIGSNRSLGARNLMSSTTYMYAVTISDTSSARDTVICQPYTFTTKAYPVFPTVTVQEIPKIGTSELIISAVATGTRDSFYIHANYGILFDDYSDDTIRANGTTTGTLHLNTPNAQDEITYCIWIHSDLLGDRLINCDSFITPSFAKDTIRGVTATSGMDSIKLLMDVGIGTYAGNLQVTVKDSSGTVVRTSSIIPANVSGLYPYVATGLMGNSPYSYQVIIWNAIGTDTFRGTIRTKPYNFGLISNTSATAYIDSFRIFATITLGTFHASIKFVKKDSTGAQLQISPVIQANTNGIYSYAFAGTQGTLYRFAIIINDSVHVDSISGAIRTLRRILAPAPVAYFKTNPAPVTYCGHIDLAGYAISGTGRAAIIRAFNDSNAVNMRDTTRSFFVTDTSNQGTYSESAPRTQGRYYWRIVTWSTDGVMAFSTAISAPTYNGSTDSVSYQVSPVGFATSANPTISISGDAYCVSTVLYFTYYNVTTGQTFFDTVDVGYGITNGMSIPFNHPPGDYEIGYNLRNANGLSIFVTLPRVKRNNIVTGIRNNISEQVSIFPVPNNGLINIQGIEKGEITVYDVSGQVVFKAKSFSNQVDIMDKPAGIYIITIETDNDYARKEVVKF